jgi:ssDNA-binding Zn-finger/Zn-ribbon topoisomerase 1
MKHRSHLLLGGVSSVALALIVSCFAASLEVQAQRIAEGGSPLYLHTVHESVEGLKGRGKAAEEGKVCPHCGKVHALVAESGANRVAAAPAPQFLPNQPCPVCGQIHPPAASTLHTNALVAPSVMGQSNNLAAGSARFYYCPNCKVYHQVQQHPPAVFHASVPGLKPAGTNTSPASR